VEKPTRPRQVFLYVAPFPPLAFFKIWASLGQDPNRLFMAAIMMLAYCALIIAIAYQWDRPTYFDWSVAGYFTLASFSLAVWPDGAGSLFVNYVVTGIYACLFAAAFFPPLLGMDPFTNHYAKKYTPRDYWRNPAFVTINQIMTYVWAAIFALCIVTSLYPSPLTRAIIPVGLMIGVGLPFNLRFPDYYLRRLGLPSLSEQRKAAQANPEALPPTLRDSMLPTSAWQAVTRMPDVFNPDATGDLSALIRFHITGSETFDAHIRIQNRQCSLEKNVTQKPDLIIRSPSDVWLGIARRELDGQRAFMEQAFSAEGDLGILLRLNQIFGGRSPRPGVFE
jgi:hypothetical protein